MPEKYRDYVVRKYVRARNAEEAIRLSRDLPVSEVNEMSDKPETQNEKGAPAPCIGFSLALSEEIE